MSHTPEHEDGGPHGHADEIFAQVVFAISASGSASPPSSTIAATINFGISANGFFGYRGTANRPIVVSVSAGAFFGYRGTVSSPITVSASVGAFFGYRGTVSRPITVSSSAGAFFGYKASMAAPLPLSFDFRIWNGDFVSTLYDHRFYVDIVPNIPAVHGVKSSISAPITMTASSAQTSYVSSTETDTETILRVMDASRFAVGQQIDVFENGMWETTEIKAVSGQFLTCRPKLTNPYSKKAIVAAMGAYRAIAMGANGRLATVQQPIGAKMAAIGFAHPFTPRILASVEIGAQMTGMSIIDPVIGYFFTPPISVSANMVGAVRPTLSGAINATVEVYPDIYSDYYDTGGDIDAVLPLLISATGKGYTVEGSVQLGIEITAALEGLQETSGEVSATVGIEIEAEGESEPINSIYGKFEIAGSALGIVGEQIGSIAAEIPLEYNVRGQTVGEGYVHGVLDRPVVVQMAATMAAHPTGRVSSRALMIQSSIAARSLMSDGSTPVPNGFRYGQVRGSRESTMVLVIGGTTGHVDFAVIGGEEIGGPFYGNGAEIASQLATAIGQIFIPPYAEPLTASANANTLTITAPYGSGANLANDEVDAVFALTGDRAVNGTDEYAVVVFSGGYSANVIVGANALGKQFEDGEVVAILEQPIEISAELAGNIRAYSGKISSSVVIKCQAFDTVRGPTVAKVGPYAVMTPTVYSQHVAKVTAAVQLVNAPSSGHVSKVVAYAVLVEENADAYMGMFFN